MLWMIQVVALDRDIIDDDRVQLEVIYSQEPMPVASHKTFGFRAVQRCIESVFRHDNVLVVPGLYCTHRHCTAPSFSFIL
jgi:hypothetical protein